MANTFAFTLRLEKGSALTYKELDDNFRYLEDLIGDGGGGGGATFDEDGDTGMEVELTPDEDFVRFYSGNTIPGYSNVQSIMTISSNGVHINMGKSNTYGIYVDGNTSVKSANVNANGIAFSANGAPITFRAGYGSNTIYHANTVGGNIELYPGGPNDYANTASGNTSTPNTVGVVRIVGPFVENQAVIRYYDSSANNYVGIQSPANLVSSYTITLPTNAGFDSFFLATDGTGNTYWSGQANSDITRDTTINGYPADTRIAIFTSNSTVFGDSALTYNRSSNTFNVQGTIQGQSKSFYIKHPTKANMMLRHGSLEGPEHGVYCRGIREGENFVHLPDYWQELIDPETITIHVTPMGPYNVWVDSWASYIFFVDSDIGELDDLRFSYIVYAERKDIPKLRVEEYI